MRSTFRNDKIISSQARNFFFASDFYKHDNYVNTY